MLAELFTCIYGEQTQHQSYLHSLLILLKAMRLNFVNRLATAVTLKWGWHAAPTLRRRSELQ